MFVNRGFGADTPRTATEFESTAMPAPLFVPPPPVKTPPRPVPSVSPAPSDATYVAPPPAPAVPSADEQNLAQRIYNAHQKMKVLAKARKLTPDMVKRAQEFSKFLQWMLATYPNLRPTYRANLEMVVRETPGAFEGGLGVVGLIIFGISLVVGAFISYEIRQHFKDKMKLQEKEIDAKLLLVTQGKSADEIKKIMDSGGGGAPNQGGLFSGLGDFAKYGLLGALVYFGYQTFVEKRRPAGA